MPRDIPVVPVSGTVITVPWATTIINAINWLYGLTGSANPPGAGYSIDSVSTTATTWVQKVNRGGDTMTNDLQVNRSALAAPTTGFLVLGNDTAKFFGFDGTTHVLATPRFDIRNDLYVYRVGTPAQGYVILGNNAAHYVGFDGTNIVADGSQIRTVANDTRVGVPLNAVVWFPTLADLTAAGASWTRETTLDGRLPIGAGTTFSQTFVEATNYGSNWQPGSILGISAGTLATVATSTGNISSGFAREGTGASIVAPDHSHTIPALTITGSPTLSGTANTWFPPMRAGIFGRRI
jgi:hypothetical protein